MMKKIIKHFNAVLLLIILFGVTNIHAQVPVQIFEKVDDGMIPHEYKKAQDIDSEGIFGSPVGMKIAKGWHVAIYNGNSANVYEEDVDNIPAMDDISNIRIARKINTLEDQSDIVYVYVRPYDILHNNININRLRLGEAEPESVGVIPSHIQSVWVIEANLYDILTFSYESEQDFKIASIRVYDYNSDIYPLKPSMLWKDARSRYARIPSADASRFSYDLVEIPPVYIDKPDGGIRKQIFSSLKEDDTDWTPIDGDIALKDQFSVIDLNLGEGGMDSKSVFGKTSFSKVISQTISGEAEFAGVVKPEGSYGFSEGTEESWEENSVYTYARRTAEVYGIELVPDNIDFTKEFIKAVKNLPSTNVNGENDEVYKDFIRAWGTHYPEKVVYGGYFMAVMTESFKEHMEKETSTEEWAAAVVVDGTAEASVGTDEASVSKTIGYKGKLGYESSSKESKEITIGSETSTYSFQYRGGQGSSSENYTIGDDVVPVGIELKRLEGLFDQKYFEEEIPNLNKKAKILGDLISGHLEYAERIDTRKQMSGFEIYELYDVSLEVISCDDSGSEMELYGSIEIGNGDFITVFQKSGIGADKEWIDVKCEGETFKVKDKGGTGEIRRIYITPDKNGSTEKSLNQKFSIRYQFSEHDEGGREEHDILSELKYHHKTITDLRNELKNQGKDEIEYSHKIKRDGFVDMNIKYKIKKIPLGLNESNVQVNN